MLYSAKVVGIPDIENAIRRDIWFPVIGQDRETYGNILNYLISRCNPETWTMTLMHERTGESEVESLPPIRERYRPYRIRTEVFQGAADRHAVTTITDICRCTPQAIDLFRRYANFFAIEDEIDVAFYDGDTCLLRTINHERNLNLNPVFFQDLTSVIESEKHLGERYFNDYPYCTGNALPYGLDVTDREMCATVFLKIFPYCDTFSLIRRGERLKRLKMIFHAGKLQTA